MKWTLFRFGSRVAAIGLAVTVLAGCATVPETGRTQFNIMSPGEEMQLGLTSFEQMKKEIGKR